LCDGTPGSLVSLTNWMKNYENISVLKEYRLSSVFKDSQYKIRLIRISTHKLGLSSERELAHPGKNKENYHVRPKTETNLRNVAEQSSPYALVCILYKILPYYARF
jgi:hypothetical protein